MPPLQLGLIQGVGLDQEACVFGMHACMRLCVCGTVRVYVLPMFCCVQEVWLDQEDVQLLREGEEVTLMDWGNAFVQTITKSQDGKTITGTAQAAVMCLSCVPQCKAQKMQEWYALSKGRACFGFSVLSSV